MFSLSFNTASGKHYCNEFKFISHFSELFIVSIPQAVSTIAILYLVSSKVEILLVSIPQAVSTIAIHISDNFRIVMFKVSIPQAVSTIAILSLN